MNKTLQVILLGLIGIALLLGGFAGGIFVGRILPLAGAGPFGETPIFTTPTTSPDTQAATPQDLQTLFKPFWEAWQIIHAQFVDQPVDDTKLMEGAINGMMESLGDQHSTYMDPQTYKDANAQLAGSYEGIGAYVDTTGKYLTITSPIPGSPAEKAGLQPGDEIIGVDHKDVTGINPEIVRTRVIGPAGTTVHLTIRRAGESAPLEFDIVRAKIDVPSASGKMLDSGFAYVQVTTFGTNTTQELTDTLKTLMAQHPKGIILDLRNNGGGYLQTAVEVVSQFQDKGVALYEQYGDGTKKSYDVISGGLATDTKIPMVVLINEGSASASEITAGALQDYGRAKLVGVVSYGKGSVQNWVPLSNDQGAVRITIAHWLTPNNHQIDKIGLTPDVYVPMNADDRKAGRDPQLDAAVEVLQAMLSGSVLPTSVPTPVVTPTP
ncbi:MAG TPA: S41 family peptidase [Anaerolineales bacterium]|nr:S41 family peptidase [Anaerolineales bacterium]